MSALRHVKPERFHYVHVFNYVRVMENGKIKYSGDGHDWNVRIEDYLPLLNEFLYKVQKIKDHTLPIPYGLALAFSSRMGACSFTEYLEVIAKSRWGDFSTMMVFPNSVVDWHPQNDGSWSLTNVQELCCFQFLYYLRRIMVILVENPIGEKKETGNSVVVQKLINLPRRHALVKVDDRINEVVTMDTHTHVSDSELDVRMRIIQKQTRERYCRPAREVERERERRMGIDGSEPDIVVKDQSEERTPDKNEVVEDGGNKDIKKRKRISEVEDEGE